MSSSSFTRYGLGERTFVDLTARDADEIPRRRLDGHRWTIGRELTDLRATPRAASDANP